MAPDKSFKSCLVILRNEHFQKLCIRQSRSVVPEHDSAKLLEDRIYSRSGQVKPSLVLHTRSVPLYCPIAADFIHFFLAGSQLNEKLGDSSRLAAFGRPPEKWLAFWPKVSERMHANHFGQAISIKFVRATGVRQ